MPEDVIYHGSGLTGRQVFGPAALSSMVTERASASATNKEVVSNEEGMLTGNACGRLVGWYFTVRLQ
jgi:hypothetical protein